MNDNQDQDNNFRRYTPNSDLEFQYATTKPTYSDRNVSPRLGEKLNIKKGYLDEDGKFVVISEENELTNFELFTADIRLGNLSPIDNEPTVVQYDLELAFDLLQAGMKKSSQTLRAQAVSIIEVSHSRKGWMRRLLGTRRVEQSTEYLEPKRSTIFGSNKRD